MAKAESSKTKDSWLYRRLRSWRRRPHFNTAAAIFLVLGATLCGAGFGLVRGMLIAFDVSAVIFLVAIVHKFVRADLAQLRQAASEEDGGRWGVLWSSVAVSIVALGGLTMELHGAGSGSAREIVLAVVSLVLSWVFLNTMFALHYAHEYYMCENKVPALDIPSTPAPDYWDFAYFAFVIGMTFQVSDVNIADRGIRRIALVHGIIAFFFNVGILALSINIVAGKA